MNDYPKYTVRKPVIELAVQDYTLYGAIDALNSIPESYKTLPFNELSIKQYGISILVAHPAKKPIIYDGAEWSYL